MSKLVQAMAGQYFHFLQPNQYYGFKKFSSEEQVNAFADDHPYREGAINGYPQLVKFNQLLENAINYKDLMQVFADVGETLYIDSCCHTNDKGNEIMASAIAKMIRERWNGHGGILIESYPPSPLYHHEYSFE